MRLSVFKTRLILLAFLLPAGAARGDVGPAFLQDATYPAMRFDNLSDYPAYDFYLKYGHGRGNPYASPHLGAVRSGEPFRNFEGTGRTTPVVLLAVPHGQTPPPLREHPDWYDKAPEGCLQSAHLEGVHEGAGALVPYRVRIQDGKLEVTRQPTEWEPREWVLQRPFSSVGLAAVCVLVVWFGVRFLRRAQRARAA
jgi:hypothetical protein